MQSGGCIHVETPTANYWLMLIGSLVADVYRKGNGEQHATLLERRRMSNTITQGESFMMFDVDNQPVSAIMVNKVEKVNPSLVPLRRG